MEDLTFFSQSQYKYVEYQMDGEGYGSHHLCTLMDLGLYVKISL